MFTYKSGRAISHIVNLEIYLELIGLLIPKPPVMKKGDHLTAFFKLIS